MTDRINLTKNPSFEASSTDWSATGTSVTIARYTSDGYSGTASLQVTKKATTNCGAVTASRVPVTADLKYTISAYVKVPTGEESSALRVNVAWYTAEVSGSLISTSNGTSVTVTDSLGWTRIYATFTAPATAAAALLSVTQPLAGTTDETFLIDAVLFEQADKLNTYIDQRERVNLVVNPSFKTDTTNWAGAGTGTTIARITTDSFIGDACLEITKAAVSLAGARSSDSGRISVIPSTEYAMSAYVKVPDGQEAADLKMYASWYSAVTGGSLVSASSGTISDITDADGWVRIGEVFTSPAGAYGLRVSVVQDTSGTAGKKFLLDAVLVEQSSYILNYIDEPSQATETKAVTDGFRPVPQPVITGLELKADISLGNLILNSIDENKVVWVCTDINGWWTIADPEIQDIPRGFADGSYIAKGKYLARQLELSGSFFPPDRTYVSTARNTFIEAVNLVRSGAWLIVDENPPKASYVRLSGRPEITTTTARGRTDFTVGLIAGDPIKYEWDSERSDGYKTLTIPCKSGSPVEDGIDTVTNSGNAEVYPVFSILGPVTANATITNSTTGEVLEIIEGFTGDYTLEIDTYNRSVTLITNSTGARTTAGIRSYLDTLTDWVKLVPGANQIEFDDAAANGTAVLTVYYRSGWVG